MVTNDTIAENECLDCIQELTEKLSDERKLSSEQNTRRAELEEQIRRTAAFITMFEKWLADVKSEYSDNKTSDLYWMITHADKVFHSFKAQHTGDDKTEAE